MRAVLKKHKAGKWAHFLFSTGPKGSQLERVRALTLLKGTLYEELMTHRGEALKTMGTLEKYFSSTLWI
jgi:hypothetical protein